MPTIRTWSATIRLDGQCMRAFVFASILSALLASGAGAAAPRRVASLNLCTDELLLMLAAPGHIASVTHLSQNKAETPLWRLGRQHRKNDGSLLSVVGLAPDLVLTMGGGARDRTRIAQRLGIRTLDLPFPEGVSDIERSISLVGTALGQKARAEALLSEITALKRSRPSAPLDTIWLGGGGRSVAANGLAGEWMLLAGFRQRALRGDRVSLEQMLVSPPHILLRSDYRSGQYSGEQRWLAHPLAKARKSRTIVTDGRRWTCMGPAMIGEIRRLKQVLQP